MSVGGVILAAGRSVRMAQTKLLLPYRGRPLLCHAVECMAGAPVAPVICVLGHQAGALGAVLRSYTFPQELILLKNEAYASGRSSSVRVALRALPEESEAAVFLPGDMPLLLREDVTAVVTRFELTGAPLVVAVDEHGTRAHPVLFARRLFPRLVALSGDESGNDLIQEYWNQAEKVPVPRSRVTDIDTHEDYRRLLNEGGG